MREASTFWLFALRLRVEFGVHRIDCQTGSSAGLTHLGRFHEQFQIIGSAGKVSRRLVVRTQWEPQTLPAATVLILMGGALRSLGHS